MKENVHKTQEKSLRSLYKESIQSKENIGLTNAINIAKNYDVIRALKENDRSIAVDGLGLISKEFKEFTNYKIGNLAVTFKTLHFTIISTGIKRFISSSPSCTYGCIALFLLSFTLLPL